MKGARTNVSLNPIITIRASPDLLGRYNKEVTKPKGQCLMNGANSFVRRFGIMNPVCSRGKMWPRRPEWPRRESTWDEYST